MHDELTSRQLTKKKRKSGSKEVDVSQERTMRNLKEEVEGRGSSMNSPPKE